MNLKQFWNRINNMGTILALAGYILTIVIKLGFDVDEGLVLSIVENTCRVLIILGVLNNPTTKGVDNPLK